MGQVRRPRHGIRIALALLVLSVVALGAIAWRDTMADPTVRTAQVSIDGLPPGQRPLRLLLLSDLHVAGPEMPPARLARIVALANAQRADLVLMAGDFISDRTLSTRSYSYREALAPLAAIRAPLGSVAVLGNHDYWRSARDARRELARIGVEVLTNTATRRGPLAIGGLDYDFTGRGNLARTLPAIRALGGVPVMLAHSPDLFPRLPSDIPLMLAGHTHCGQVRLPLLGTPVTNSRFGQRYACGLVRENGRTLIVSAGLGVSVLPFRFGVRPDMWLIELRPPDR